MTQPIGAGWITCHLALKHPYIATGVLCAALAYHYIDLTPTAAISATAPKVAVITFDDGNDSDLRTAAPVLEKYDFVATFYPVGETLTRVQSQLLTDKYGWEEGYHTITHPHLPTLPEADRIRQVTKPERFRHVEAFASPYGEYDPDIIALLKSAGFTSHVTNQDVHDAGNPLPLANPFEINRVGYKRGYDLVGLCEQPRAPNNALVVTFHRVVYDHATTAYPSAWDVDEKTLDRFIQCLSQNGYQSLTISDLVQKAPTQ